MTTTLDAAAERRALRILGLEICTAFWDRVDRSSKLEKKNRDRRPGMPHGKIIKEVCARSYLLESPRKVLLIPRDSLAELRRAVGKDGENPIDEREFRRYLAQCVAWGY